MTVILVTGSTYEISGLSSLDATAGVYILMVNAAGVEDATGSSGTGSGFTSWVMASTAPAVSVLTGVTQGSRNTPVGSVSVTFTEPIDPSSFSFSALSLSEGGGSNLITQGSGVSITQQGPDTYQISGLSSLTTSDGDYILTVDATQVTDPSDTPGVGSVSVSWTTDSVGPQVQSFSSVFSPRNAAVDSIDVTFSKPIDPSTFTAAALSLTQNGGGNLINASVSVALVSGSTYEIDGLTSLDALMARIS